MRDLNATFEELGKLVKFYIQIEHCMTKLQILKQAVNLITALAQQVRG